MITFLNIQINHIKERGLKEIFVKLLILLKIIISKTGMIISLPALVIVIFLSPFISVRFGILNCQRIGHFTSNLDLYFFKKKYEKEYNSKIFLDVLSYNVPISNKFLFKKIKEIIKIHNYLYVRPIYDLILLLSNKFNFFRKFLIPSFSPSIFDCADHDEQDILINNKPLIEFSEDEKTKGHELLKNIGVNDNKYICLIMRDSKYLNDKFKRNDWSYHDYRNINIDDCSDMINELCNLGYYVIRMGRNVEKKVSLKNEKVIDYANSKYASDFGDIFLFSKCKFCISSGTGPDMIARLFRKKVGRLMTPVGDFHTSSLDINATFPHYSHKLKRNLNLKEIYDHGLFRAVNTSQYRDKQVELIKNNKDLFKNFAIFCVDIYENKVINPEVKNKQNIFWEQFKKYKKKHNLKINSIIFDDQNNLIN